MRLSPELAEAQYEASLRKIKDSNMHAIKATLGLRVTAEQQFSSAYQYLVKAGLRPQIRRKYRG